MFTQQSGLLSSSLDPNAVAALANCAQPLSHRGPVSLNSAAGLYPPQSGYWSAGNWNNSQSSYNDLRQWLSYNGTTWNVFNPSAAIGPPVSTSGADGGTYVFNNDPAIFNNYIDSSQIYGGNQYFTTVNQGDFWGGDVQYGDVNTTNQSTNNINNWYNSQFNDNAYNDFSTNLNVTSNFYNQSVTQLGGDTYGDTVNVNNLAAFNVTNHGPVINNNTVTNHGATYYEGPTYLSENVFVNGKPIAPWIEGQMKPPPKTYRLQGTIKIPTYTFNATDCSLTVSGYQDADMSGLQLVES